MTPQNIQIIQQELAILWEDQTETYIPFQKLRLSCPCALCSGETDVLGNQYKAPSAPLPATAFEPLQLQKVGGYALTIQWKDGHAAGIYPYPLLKKLGAS